MHRLFILRHAKSAPSKPGMNDHDRPLAPRGRLALPTVARHITELLEGRPLDLVLCSPAARTRETVAGITAAIGETPVRFKRRLYLADLDDLLDVLRGQADDVHSILLCGHNPGLHQLALALLGDAAPPALAHDLPTAGLVVIDVDGGWTSAGTVAATLTAFTVPGDD